MKAKPVDTPLGRVCAQALRVLVMDMVEQAGSGHPGAPMGLAEAAEVLFRRHLRHNPKNPAWPNRDRFVLSNGHASALLYASLHLCGYDISQDDLKNFRRFQSQTPGHPEFGRTPGVEASTGPLGQGLAMAVGMALAEKLLAHTFNREGFPLVDYRTYVMVGDGCLMEGISYEAASLAGQLQLGKIIALYDANGISIDGRIDAWFSEDVACRFRAMGWRVLGPVDGHDSDAIDVAIEEAKAKSDSPALVILSTTIAKGAPTLAGQHAAHGAPLGEKETQAVRDSLFWTHEPFVFPQEVKASWDTRQKGEAREAAWKRIFEEYAKAHPELAEEFCRRLRGATPPGWEERKNTLAQEYGAFSGKMATRQASAKVLDAISESWPELLGGSADLTPSVLTRASNATDVNTHGHGNYIHYGVREFAMAAVENGLALAGGFLPYGGTFLVFSDYLRAALRLGALMKTTVVHVFTHDSVAVGEDGPTHQPVEHLASLRLIPGLEVWRPASLLECFAAWTRALESRPGPIALALSRQAFSLLCPSMAGLDEVSRGGYVFLEASGGPEVIFLSTGSEVALSCEAQALLQKKGVAARVVSMPCCEVFDRQDLAYREKILIPGVPVVAVEAGSGACWWRYVRGRGTVVGIEDFGESGKGEVVLAHFGFTPQEIAEKALEVLG